MVLKKMAIIFVKYVVIRIASTKIQEIFENIGNYEVIKKDD